MNSSGSASQPLRVLIAGGGVAAVEVLLALRATAGERVAIDLVAPNRELVYRPLSVAEPFGIGHAYRFPLDEIADAHGARIHPGLLTEVDAYAHCVHTSEGELIEYDVLIVATGARQRQGVRGAITLSGDKIGAYREVLEGLETGTHLVFALPPGTVWSLPLYEIALMTATWVEARGIDVKLGIVTPEDLPLGVFGRRVAKTVGDLLAARRIDVRCGAYPVWFENGVLAVRPVPDIECTQVVALPELRGPAVHGLPHDAAGFLPTDSFCAVTQDVYAAGDGTTFPVKQGGLAVQQADVIANVIAARAGASVDPEPFEPVLDGLLLTGTIPHYLHGDLRGGRGEDASSAEVEPTWWPPTKFAGGYLSRYVARLAAAEPPNPDTMWLRLETDDLEAYLQRAGAGTISVKP